MNPDEPEAPCVHGTPGSDPCDECADANDGDPWASDAFDGRIDPPDFGGEGGGA